MSYWSVIATPVRDDTAALTGSGVALRPWLANAGSFDDASTVAFPSQSNLAVGNHFTVTFWFRTAAFTGQQVLVESGGYVYGWAVLLSDSELHFVWSNYYNGQVVSHSLSGRESESIHVAVQVNGQQMSLLVDGLPVGTATHPTAY